VQSKSSVIFGDTTSEVLTYKNNSLLISKNIIPSENSLINLGNNMNSFECIHTKHIHTNNNDNNISIFTPISSTNNSTVYDSSTNWIMKNGSNVGLKLSLFGCSNVYTPNAALITNEMGDLHIGNQNLMTFYKSNSLNNTVCINIAQSNITTIRSYVGDVTQYKLLVNGLCWSTGWRTVSDENLKENINVITEPCEKLALISGYKYNMKNNPEKTCVGLLAQELKNIFPDSVDVMHDGSYSIDYNSVIALLVESVKELYYKLL